MDEAEDLAPLRSRLLHWFDRHARDLPWRRASDPYAIWVSEVMLQQTRVDTVVPYWRRWMERWPTVEDLAEADLDDVLKQWEGLGYYRRARMLHRAAGMVRDRLGGELPDDAAGLRRLPGVGEYTAGAVASIAFGEAVPAVDGNVRRVLARLFDLPSPGASELRGRAADLVDPERPGDFNQALMELGATVCTPASPDCGRCPVAGSCRARALGVQEERPLPGRRGPVPVRSFAVAVPLRRGSGGGAECLLRRRPPDGFLGGLWEFPARRVAEPGGDDVPPEGAGGAARAARRAAREVLPERGAGIGCIPLPRVTQAYSHFVGRYLPFAIPVEPGAPRAAAGEARWVPLDGLGDLAVPAAQRRIALAALEVERGAAANPSPEPS